MRFWIIMIIMILWSILSPTNPGISIEWNVDLKRIVNLSFWLNHGIFSFSTTDGTGSEEFSQRFSHAQMKYGRFCIWFAFQQRNCIVLKSWSRAQIFLLFCCLKNYWDDRQAGSLSIVQAEIILTMTHQTSNVYWFDSLFQVNHPNTYTLFPSNTYNFQLFW